MQKTFSRLIKNKIGLLGGLTLLTVSCTKSIPYKELPAETKQDVVGKDLLDLNGEYIYSTSMLNASRSSSDALPFATGDNKRVKLQLTETSLKILEMERDQRFADNSTNNKLVLEIPVEHIDFQCAKDKFGECTNTEEAVSDKKWFEKGKIKVKLESAKSGGLDILPIMISQTVGENCYQEVSSRVTNYSIEKDALNFNIERTFKTNIDCLGEEFEKLSDATVSAVFHYSLARTSSVLTPGFKTVSYPNLDEGTFGFFSTERRSVGVDNNRTESGLERIMNHWHPGRSEILYLLSDEFGKPENRKIKELTEKTVGNLNAGLAEAGATFRIRLEMANGRSVGDIRNSSIVLVEDPVASSIIGYGPQVEDPLTGEIISARTVMFLGTIKKYVKYTYEDIIASKKQDKLARQKMAQLKLSEDLLQKTLISKNLLSGKSILIKKEDKKEDIGGLDESNGKIANSNPINNRTLTAATLKQIESTVKDYQKNSNQSYEKKDKVAQLKYMLEAKNCAFSMNAELVNGGISEKLKNKFSEDSKPWLELSESEKQAVIDIVLPEIWVPTLIHEMGHNLGLRHNFQGSEDKDNFYSDQELASRNIDHKVPFSTVMEYGDDLKALPVLGKYDIAALKFAYNREVQTKTGEFIKIQGSLSDMKKAGQLADLKEYGYCTDENVGANAGCKRFDLGTTYTEITQNLIDTYEDSYKRRNFRNDRVNFSAYGDIGYANRVAGQFAELRIMAEVLERIRNRFNLPDDHPAYEQVAWLKDLKQAAVLAGKFLAKVVRTPDVTCVVVEKANPTEIVELARLKSFDPDASSCYAIDSDIQGQIDQAGLAIVGQAGKFINSFKDSKSENPYVDQIDVRGVWIDKMIATKLLFARNLGSATFDKYTDNMTDLADLKDDLADLTQSFALNSVTDDMEITLIDGSKQKVETTYDMFESTKVNKLIDSRLSKALEVPDRDFYLTENLMSTVKKDSIDELSTQRGLATSESVSVRKVSKTDPRPVADREFARFETLTDIYLASKANTVARKALELRDKSATMSQLERAKLLEILKAKMADENAKPPPKATREERAVWRLAADDLIGFLTGAIQSKEFYEKLVTLLPN